MNAAVDAVATPFFFVPGNRNDLLLTTWRKLHGSPWYAFLWKNALFLVLDTEDPPVDMPPAYAKEFHQLAAAMKTDPVGTKARLKDILANVNARRATPKEGAKGEDPMQKLMSARIGKAQLQWALQTLRQHADVRWTFVLMHKPAWPLQSAAFTEIGKALANRPYTVIAGHNHYYTHEKRLGRAYITMGTAGATSHQHGPGELDHLAWVTLQKNAAGKEETSIELLKLSGILDLAAESGQPLVKEGSAK